MKVLATAFCCKPNSGSESAFAWWWATDTALDHEVVVITVESQKDLIEAELANREDLSGLRFEYVKGPREVSASGSSNRFERVHQYLWQLRAIPTARRIARDFRPDVAQHVSTGTWRQPLALASTNVPTIAGPVAGSERLPRGFARSFGLRAFAWETARSALIRLAKIDPLVYLSLRRCRLILVAGGATRNQLTRRFPGKTEPATRAFAHPAIAHRTLQQAKHVAGEALRLTWVGRLIPTKGLTILLEALRDPRLAECTLDVMGGGQEVHYRELAKSYGLDDRVNFRGHVGRDELFDIVSSNHLFVFTSLQELMGQSLSEAMQLGAACVVFDWSGAGALVGDTGGAKIPVSTPKEAPLALADELARIRFDGSVAELQRAALERINHLIHPEAVRERRLAYFHRASSRIG